MFHNIGDKKYHCEYKPREPNFENDYLLSFRDDEVLLSKNTIPHLKEVWPAGGTSSVRFLFSISDTAFYLTESPVAESENLSYESIRVFRKLLPQWLAFAGVTGYHLWVWYKNHKYCGACTNELIHKREERALVCPQCGNIIYPNISVAVIVGIIDGDKILLSKYSAGNQKDYALIAGYVEIGESLEDTVRREVWEEVGLHVKNIRYYNNQPWGFSQSMLVGFFADLDGPSKITLDLRELSDAVWMERQNLPEGKSSFSLTAKMIETFRLSQFEK